ncbi:hypothetical protein ELC62_30455, partial [Klebsiella pneumoniae]|nr:hypothetical protein [Klebsiella pneumoniae]
MQSRQVKITCRNCFVVAIYDIITLIQAQKKDIRNIMVRIERVDRGSYAEKAGIKPGDKLISINGKD